MAKVPVNKYHKSIIYKIEHNINSELVYIGGTTNFAARKNQHKSRSQNPNDKEHNVFKYKMIRENGGWNSFRMVPLKELSCESKVELEIEEEKVREEHKAKLNQYKAYCPDRSPRETKKEYQENAAKKLENYRREHAEEILTYKNSKPFLLLKTKKYTSEDYKE